MSDPGPEPERTATRRTVLATAGTLAVAGVAGCTATTPGGANNTSTAGSDHHGDETTTGHHDESGGDGHDHGHESTLDAPVTEATVTVQSREDGHHFDPHVVWVEQGGTVTWELASGTHTATAYAPANDRPRRIPEDGAPFDSGMLADAGETFTRTFQTAGVYDYYCLPHEASGMIGSVVVGEPDPDAQPALAEPDSELPDEAREKLASLNDRVAETLGHGHDEATEEGHHEDDSGDEHHGETDHHEGTETDSGHHEETDHHEGTETDSGHHEDDSGDEHHGETDHHEGTETDSGHHG